MSDASPERCSARRRRTPASGVRARRRRDHQHPGLRVPRVSAPERRRQRRATDKSAAQAALAAAQGRLHERANGTLTGKDRALKELDTFYSSVLAQDLTGARRLTFARLAQLAANSQPGLRTSQVRAGRRARQQPDTTQSQHGPGRELRGHSRLHPRDRVVAGVRGHR